MLLLFVLSVQAFGVTEEGAKPPKPAKSSSSAGVGVMFNMSTLGFGGDVAFAVNKRSNVRVGFNAFNYSRTFDKDGVTYAGKLGLRSLKTTYDFYPIGGFHLSPGLMLYNGNQLTANASVSGGQTFDFNGVTYTSSDANPITGTGKMTMNKVAPMLLFGFGNLIPRSGRHVTFNLDLGVVFQGSPNIKLNFKGNACDESGLNCVNAATDPTFLSNVMAEQKKLNDSAKPFKYYPVISFGIGYRFGGGPK
jgi:hypothetical protein